MQRFTSAFLNWDCPSILDPIQRQINENQFHLLHALHSKTHTPISNYIHLLSSFKITLIWDMTVANYRIITILYYEASVTICSIFIPIWKNIYFCKSKKFYTSVRYEKFPLPWKFLNNSIQLTLICVQTNLIHLHTPFLGL